jgi:ketosteroid isomerase-like protein
MRAFATVAVTVAALSGCHHAAPRAPAIATSDAVAAATRAIEHWRQAYEARDLKALEPLYAHDLDVTIAQPGVPLIGWSSVDAMLKDRIGRAREVRLKLSDLRVAILTAEVVTATATMAREVSDGVTSVAEFGTLTLVLHRVGESWVLAVEHFSPRPRT